MLAMFTPEELPPWAELGAQVVFQVWVMLGTQHSRYTPSASLLPVTNSLCSPRWV